MESLLKRYNIRDQLDKKMSEFDSQSQGNQEMNVDVNSESRVARSASAGAKNSSNQNESSGILCLNE